MKDAFLKVVKYMAEHGELLKAYYYLQTPPSYIEDDPQILNYLADVQKQLDTMKQIQTKGQVDGMLNVAFRDPVDVSILVAFQHLQKRLIETGIDNLVDIGCYTGWMGRELSGLGIKVHGIDVHPVIMQMAAYKAVGTLATFEYLPVQKLGHIYPKKFGGAIMFDVLEHVFDPNIAIKSVSRAVKDGGRIFINLPHPIGEGNTTNTNLEEHEHLHSFSQKRVKELFPNADIKILENEGGTINWFIEHVV